MKIFDFKPYYMLKRLLFLILFYQSFSFVKAQQTYDDYYDSVQRILSIAKDDTAKVLLLAGLSFSYQTYQVDTSILYSQRAIRLARQLNYKNGEAVGLYCYAWALWMSETMTKQWRWHSNPYIFTKACKTAR